jgi:hypothetical protein
VPPGGLHDVPADTARDSPKVRWRCTPLPPVSEPGASPHTPSPP